MLDLDRVKSYIELGFEKEDAIKMVDKEMKKEKAEKPPIEEDDTPDVDLSGYVKKEDVDKQIEDAVSKALEKKALEKAEVDPPEKKDIGELINKFF